MAATVFLHVGVMKSATSYLQNLCEENAATLDRTGLWWPGIRRTFVAMRELWDPQDQAEFDWPALAADIAARDGDVLLSNEMLSFRSPATIRKIVEALAPASVEVVITARDVARAVPSQWQTKIRNGSVRTWADYAAAVCDDAEGSVDDDVRRFWRGQDLVALLDRWCRVVDQDQVTLVTVPPPGADPTTVARRFFEVLRRDETVTSLTEPAYGNVSLGAHSAELVRRLNGQTADWNERDYRRGIRVGLCVRQLTTRAAVEPRFRLSDEQVGVIATRAQGMVASLRTRGVRVVGDLADLVPVPGVEAPGADPAASTPDELLAAAEYGLLGLARQVSEADAASPAVQVS